MNVLKHATASYFNALLTHKRFLFLFCSAVLCFVYLLGFVWGSYYGNALLVCPVGTTGSIWLIPSVLSSLGGHSVGDARTVCVCLESAREVCCFVCFSGSPLIIHTVNFLEFLEQQWMDLKICAESGLIWVSPSYQSRIWNWVCALLQGTRLRPLWFLSQ